MPAAAPLVYIVDDDEAFRDSLRWMMRTAGYRVEVYASAEDFLAKHVAGAGACLVLDLRMPGMNGLELQEALMRAGEAIPIVFVTAHGDVALAVRAVKRGAFDFIEKPFKGQALLALVRQALRQDRRDLIAAVQSLEVAERLASLTPREHDVMKLVLEGKTNKAIASELAIGIKTVETHRAHMMEKLGAKSIAEHVRIVVAAPGVRASQPRPES
jgi:FixJ family two-component response regulator